MSADYDPSTDSSSDEADRRVDQGVGNYYQARWAASFDDRSRQITGAALIGSALEDISGPRPNSRNCKRSGHVRYTGPRDSDLDPNWNTSSYPMSDEQRNTNITNIERANLKILKQRARVMRMEMEGDGATLEEIKVQVRLMIQRRDRKRSKDGLPPLKVSVDELLSEDAGSHGEDGDPQPPLFSDM